MSSFSFRYFTVRQTHSAMKVGTDAMLLGSIAQFDAPHSLLDIGSGTGVLSLMIAQRYPILHVTAIECDPQACLDARHNFNQAAFPGCSFELIETDIRTWKSDQTFDAIISNPPYFENSFKSDDAQRNKARHTDETLSFVELVRAAKQHLSEQGTFWVVLPHTEQERFTALCRETGLVPVHVTEVLGKPGIPVRVVLAFSHTAKTFERHELTVRDEKGAYTEAYIALTRAYHDRNLSKD